MLSKAKGDYLKKLGFYKELLEEFAWNNEKRNVEDWLRKGAELEDASSFGFPIWPGSTTRSFNHFHNPLKKDWNQAGLNDLWTGESSLLWAQDRSNQQNIVKGDQTWQQARDYFFLALTSGADSLRQENFAKMFNGLGHQMHLLQDTAVPDHVRNDAHPEDAIFGSNPRFGSYYFETWAKRTIKTLAEMKSFAPNPVFPNVYFNVSYSVPYNNLVPIAQLFDTNIYNGLNASAGINQGLSEYTNANFFSNNTIFAAENYPTDHKHYFPYPKKSSTDLQSYINQNKLPETVFGEDGVTDTGFWIKKERDGEIVDHFLKPSYYSNAISDTVGDTSLYRRTFYRDDECHKDYAQKLIPRAVGYSAGLLDYFFRGQLEVISVPGGIKVKNMNTETMSSYTDSSTGNTVGSIEIYYDDTNNIRHLLATYELQSPLSQGQETPVIAFIPPSDNIAPRKYIIVFRGKLGNEEGAIIGKVIMTQMYYVSTRDGIDKIYRMGTDGSNPEVVYDNQDPNFYIGKISLSPAGKTLVFAAERDIADPMDQTIYTLDLTSNTVSFLTMGDWPNWSPDGKKIIFQKELGGHLPQADTHIFTIDIATGTETQLTHETNSSYNGNPAWSPDGNTIAYTIWNTHIDNCYNLRLIYLMDSSGNQIGPLTCQTDSASIDAAPSWSPDGREITFIRQTWANEYYQLHKVNVATQTLTKLTDSTGKDYQEYPPSWSHGNTIALSSQRDGDFDIWMVDSNGGGYLTNLTDSNPSFDLFPTFGW